jgi:3-deoxy-D-manno-octulosonate 8-phosphate phosphatase (KDO 8-P phosphatase)
MIPRLILTDVDGVLTDGGMYYDQTGNEWKKFHTYDSFGVLLCKEARILTGIITGEDTVIVKNRSEKLAIDYVFQGVTDKLSVARRLCAEIGVDLNRVAYIGDDIGDVALLKNVGYSGAPHNAPEYIKNVVNYTTKTSGGSGAFREFVEHIFQTNEIFDQILARLLEKNNHG